MTGFLVLFAFVLWLLWLFYHDGNERTSVSPAAWIVATWAMIYGSRSMTDWFSGTGQGPNLPASFDEGNLVEALINLSFIAAGLIVLLRRGIRWPAIISDNPWLAVFYLFWLMSIIWSDYPAITFKRLFKDLGTVVMALVVLTEVESGEAIKAVCARVAYLCIPLSIILIRYYPEWGRSYGGYDHSEVMWVGVATHKNTLGVLAMVGALFLLWDLLDVRENAKRVVKKFSFVSRVLVLLMCWYLLVIANSVTSLICAVLGSALLIALSVPSIRRRPGRVEIFGLSVGLIMLVFDSTFDIKETFLGSLGRDATLTTRTDIWPMLTELQDNPILGTGFNSFWAGQRLVLLYEKFGGIIQAHNGYIETYLNGGLIGIGLLIALLLSSYWQIRKQHVVGVSGANIRFVILLIAIIYNYSEASFNKVGVLWFLTVFVIMEYRTQPSPPLVVSMR